MLTVVFYKLFCFLVKIAHCVFEIQSSSFYPANIVDVLVILVDLILQQIWYFDNSKIEILLSWLFLFLMRNYLNLNLLSLIDYPFLEYINKHMSWWKNLNEINNWAQNFKYIYKSMTKCFRNLLTFFLLCLYTI